MHRMFLLGRSKQLATSKNRVVLEIERNLFYSLVLISLINVVGCWLCNQSTSVLLLLVFFACSTLISRLASKMLAERIARKFQEILYALSEYAHELASPLAALKTNVLLAHDEAAKGDDPKVPLERIDECCERLLRLNEDLRVISIWGEPIKHSSLSILKPSNLIQDCLRQISPVLLANGQEIEISDQHNGAIIADADALKRVIFNLLENAAKYGGANCQISISLRNEDDTTLITVADNGPGIPEQVLHRIFERNFRIVNEQTLEITGNGLGLTIAKEIIESHGGTISAKRSQSGGSEFLVKLPRVPTQHPFSQIMARNT